MTFVSIAPKPEGAPLKTRTSPTTHNFNAYLGQSKGSQATTKRVHGTRPLSR